MLSTITNRRPIDKELKAMEEATGKQDRGFLIKHREIEAVTGLEKDTPAWHKLIRHWKKWTLEKRQIHIAAESGVGYRLLTVDEQLMAGVRYELQAGRRLYKAIVIAGVIPPEKLTDMGRGFQNAIVSDGREVRAMMKEKRADRKTLLSQQSSLPKLGSE